MLDSIKSWVDSIFSPIHSFLDMALEQLRSTQQVVGRGINIGQYFAVFGDLPASWQAVIVSLLVSCGVMGGLFFFRSIARLYFGLKDGVKWW